MKEILVDTLLDSVKLLPFLFLAFFIIEFIEHKFSKEAKKIVGKSGKFGPLVGSLLGLFPQCGFSVMATNLYTTRIITLGTLIAIYLSTSDEMLAIMLSNNTDISVILQLLGIKFFVGMFFGFLIDFVLRKSTKNQKLDYHLCKEDHCHCKDGLLLSSLKHTLNTILFIMVATFLLNLVIYYVGEDSISKVFLKDSLLAPFIASVVGLIPNCASSVVITQLYLDGAISFGTTVAGLLTGSGVALLVLFKSNKNLKENLTILFTVYGIGAGVGVVIELFQLLF